MKSFGFQWHLTDRCNLRCTHCYQDTFSSAGQRPLEEIRFMADRIFSNMENTIVTVNLTGGEPLLLPYLFEIVEYLDNFSCVEEINIITNGTIATQETISDLGSRPQIKTLKISLESCERNINDAIRGRGNFERLSSNLELFKKSGKETVLMMTLAKFNIESIKKTVEWARKRGLNGIIFERFVPFGRGRELISQVLDSVTWRQAVHAIVCAAGLNFSDRELAPYRAFWLRLDSDEDDRLKGALCNLGDESMALMPDGTVYPCRRLPVPVGNILKDDLSTIRNRLKKMHPRQLMLRIKGDKLCRCDEEECTGCRALAYALYGDYLADDNQCILSN